MPPRFKDVLDEAAIRYFYEERGFTMRQTWEALGSTQRVLERSMRVHKIEPRPQGTQSGKIAFTAERKARMREMRDSGMSLADIGAEFGLTRQRVHQIMRRK